MPRSLLRIAKEAARHLLRRPVVGVAVVGRTASGQWLLIRRSDTGTWALPGGTLEWGETLQNAIKRELEEEAGVVEVRNVELLGVFSDPKRDVRFHAVTVLVQAEVARPVKAPKNPLEIREAKLFEEAALPGELAMGQNDMMAVARGAKARLVLE